MSVPLDDQCEGHFWGLDGFLGTVWGSQSEGALEQGRCLKEVRGNDLEEEGAPPP